MTTLLHISASPRGEASVDEWNLWDGSLPAFGPDGAGAKMRVFAGEQPVGPQETAWHRARLAFDRFAAADLYLYSLPMWNAGIPYIAKQFIDVVSQPGMVFDFDPETGYTGLLGGRSAVVVYTSAVYGDGRPAAFGSDFQQPYFEDWLRWTGISDVSSIAFRPNLATADAELDRRSAHAAARRRGAKLGLTTMRRAS